MGFQKDFIEFWKDLNEILLRFKTTHGTAGRRGRILHICTRRHISIYIYIYSRAYLHSIFVDSDTNQVSPRGSTGATTPRALSGTFLFISKLLGSTEAYTSQRTCNTTYKNL